MKDAWPSARDGSKQMVRRTIRRILELLLGRRRKPEDGGFVHGLVVATVTDNSDPEGLARVRVQLPWQVDGEIIG